LIVVSFASDPPDENITCERPYSRGNIAQSFSASSIARGWDWPWKVVKYSSVSICSRTASMISGRPCPTATHHSPENPSIRRCPRSSVIHQPSPDTITCAPAVSISRGDVSGWITWAASRTARSVRSATAQRPRALASASIVLRRTWRRMNSGAIAWIA
jgi:hypothetical protein